MNEAVGQSIFLKGQRIEMGRVEAFLKATLSDHVQGIPPTFVTIFRHGEYEWLARLGISVEQLLHGEQEYEYRQALCADHDIEVKTTLMSFKERKGREGRLLFVVFESEITQQQKLAVLSRTTFVVKKPIPQ